MTAELEWLAKIAGLLGSAPAGERAAAALKATELLRGLGLTWRGLVEAATAQPASQRRDEPLTASEWYVGIIAILADPPHLYPRETEFLEQMARRTRFGRLPTLRQANW